MWARLLYGARYTLAGALPATVVAAIIGITAGLVAGYYGKWFESTSSWITNVLMALPGIVVLLAARAVLWPLAVDHHGPLGPAGPAFYRLVVAAVSGVRHELFVDAARVSGVSDAEDHRPAHPRPWSALPSSSRPRSWPGSPSRSRPACDFLGLGDPTIPTWATC